MPVLLKLEFKKYSSGNQYNTQTKDHTTPHLELKNNQEATKLNDQSYTARMAHDLIKRKVDIIDQRIQIIRKLITEKGSPSRIQLLHEKLQLIMEETKCMAQNSQEYTSLDEIELEVDSCGGEVAEYLESKGGMKHNLSKAFVTKLKEWNFLNSKVKKENISPGKRHLMHALILLRLLQKSNSCT